MANGFSDLSNFRKKLDIGLIRGSGIAASTLVAKQLERIHEDGIATDGSKIGDYSDKPYFTSSDKFVSTGGIPKDKISKNKKWVQLPEGYKSFRKYSGRQTDFKDLDYSSSLRQAYLYQLTEKGFVTFYAGGESGDEATPINKMRWNESIAKKEIISPSDEEVDLVVNIISDHIFDGFL